MGLGALSAWAHLRANVNGGWSGLATNLYKSDTIFFLGLNNAISIKELCHC
jgi:hypothetical protein